MATAHLIPSRGSHNYQLDAEGYWRLGDENGLLLRTNNRQTFVFQAEQAYRIVKCDPRRHDPRLGEFRVTTLMYAYELTIDGGLAWRMHWHPDGRSAEWRPHYHLPGKDHLPSGRHTLEDAVEWCILFGAVPEVPKDEWTRRLAESKGVHELYRSWSMTPGEPRG